MGIQCRVFNPIMPVLNIFMNNRDHRKITVIDGKVAYTGGYNLADEYFNITHPYGQWRTVEYVLREMLCKRQLFCFWKCGMHLENRMSILKSIFQYILIKQRNRAFCALR